VVQHALNEMHSPCQSGGHEIQGYRLFERGTVNEVVGLAHFVSSGRRPVLKLADVTVVVLP